jgi:hypothetical protein
MLKSIEGVFRDGKVELLETAPQLKEARVVVTFLPERGAINLAEHKISLEQATDLRQRLIAFTEDWDRPEMDVYDDDQAG